MKKISCNVIKDLLPLYVDDVVSDDTKELVEEHISNCEGCREEAESMGKTLVIPAESEGAQIKKIKRKMNKRKVITVCISSLLTLVIGFGLFMYLTFYGNAVSSDNVNVRTEFQYDEDAYLNQSWVIHFDLKNNGNLNTFSENNFEINEDGYEEFVGVTIYLREIPIGIFNQTDTYTTGYSYNDSYTTGFSIGDDVAPDDDFDYTFTIVYKDKTEVYSVREEGLFEKQDNVKTFGE